MASAYIKEKKSRNTGNKKTLPNRGTKSSVQKLPNATGSGSKKTLPNRPTSNNRITETRKPIASGTKKTTGSGIINPKTGKPSTGGTVTSARSTAKTGSGFASKRMQKTATPRSYVKKPTPPTAPSLVGSTSTLSKRTTKKW